MITLTDFLETINYDATTGDAFLFDCYGPNAMHMEYWDGKHADGRSISVVYDTRSHIVYEMEIWDYANNREYRWVRPDFKEALFNEHKERNQNPEESIDGRKYIDLEVAADVLEKASALYRGEPYDTRIMVEINLEDDVMLSAMKLAHEADMTFNDFVAKILQDNIDRMKKEMADGADEVEG